MDYIWTSGWKKYKMKWHKTSQILLVIGQCVLPLKFNDIDIKDTDSPHEQNKEETANKDTKSEEQLF